MTPPDHPTRFGWRWIGRSVLLRRRQALSLLAITGVVYATALVFPIAVQRAVDGVVGARNNPESVAPLLVGLLVATLAATVLEAWLTRTRRRIVIDIGTFIDRRLARLIFIHLMRARIDGEAVRGGDTLNRFTQARKIQAFVLNDVPSCVFESGSLVVSLAAMAYYDTWAALAAAVAAPVTLLFARSALAESRTASERYIKDLGQQQNVLSETTTAIATVKSLGLETQRMALWSRATDAMLASLKHGVLIQTAYGTTVQVAGRLLTLLVVAVACVGLARGHLTVGELLALQLLAGRIAGPLLQSVDIFTRYQDVAVAIGQIAAFLAMPRERAARQPPVRHFAGGGIVLKDVGLTYTGASRPALAGVDCVLPERGVVAIVGRNGAGKSTLVRILLGLNRDYRGCVLFAGHELRDYDPRWLRSQVGVVDQDTLLFSGTVRTNIEGAGRRGEEAVREALRFADALDFVEALPDGLDAPLREGGRNLSGGQRQRLSIARAVVRDPSIAILDEPAAFLDAEAAVALEERLATWGRTRLLLLVSHHLPAIRRANRILVLDGGRLVGDGPHEQLVETVPSYRALWNDYSRRSA